MKAQCDLPTGITKVGKSQTFNVTNCDGDHCLDQNISYEALSQIIALMESSSSCSQSIDFQCYSAPLKVCTINTDLIALGVLTTKVYFVFFLNLILELLFLLLFQILTQIRDHPFKKSAFLGGLGVYWLPNLLTDSSKKLPMDRGRGQKLWKFADVYMDGSHSSPQDFYAMNCYLHLNSREDPIWAFN